MLRRDFDLGVGDRFAEEVIALQIDLDLFLGQVECLIGFDLDLELGQHVALHLHRLLGPHVADDGAQVVIAHVDFVGQLEIDRRRCRTRRS